MHAVERHVSLPSCRGSDVFRHAIHGAGVMNFIIAVRAHQDADPEIAAMADNLKVRRCPPAALCSSASEVATSLPPPLFFAHVGHVPDAFAGKADAQRLSCIDPPPRRAARHAVGQYRPGARAWFPVVGQVDAVS